MKATMEEVVGRAYLLRGDMRDRLREAARAGLRAHMALTDAPYHLTSIVRRMGAADSAPIQHGRDGMYARLSRGFRGKAWDAGDIAFRAETWRLVYDCLEPGAFLLAFTGPQYHRAVVAMEEAGFQIHRMMGWLFATGVPKGKPLPLAGWEDWRYGREATKAAMEPIAVAQKPISTRTIIENVRRHGTGAINVERCRIRRPDGVLGYPSTILHSGDPVIRRHLEGPRGEQRADFFYCAKAGQQDRVYRCPVCGERALGGHPDCGHGAGESHPTAKPVALLEALIKMHTPPGGIVLDPFMGAGPSMQAAVLNGFRAVGVEREKDYYEDALIRMRHVHRLMNVAPAAE